MPLIQLFMTDVFIFIDESTCEETDIQAKIEENIEHTEEVYQRV